jgi:hypothetical protein
MMELMLTKMDSFQANMKADLEEMAASLEAKMGANLRETIGDMRSDGGQSIRKWSQIQKLCSR